MGGHGAGDKVNAAVCHARRLCGAFPVSDVVCRHRMLQLLGIGLNGNHLLEPAKEAEEVMSAALDRSLEF